MSQPQGSGGEPAKFLANEQLLFGILALQNDFVTREQFIAAFDSWVHDKSRKLAEILENQRAMSLDQRQVLESLVGLFLKKHGGNAERSLASLSTASPVRFDLQKLNDADLEASLVHVGQSTPHDEAHATTMPFNGRAHLGRFRVLRPHAKGGLGLVSVALDQELNREVAIKEIQARHADDPFSRDRFLLEAEITGGLEHPGIVPVYALGSGPDGRPYYAMRFIRGDSLKEAIEAFHQADNPNRVDQGSKELAFRQLLGRFIDVCNAIEYAHSRGVLHRDLKPGNIMIGKYGETLVVDWGLAKTDSVDRGELRQLASLQDERTLRPSLGSGSDPTLEGTIVGTPAFMSPEQATGRTNVGPACDIYSLGSTLYALLTGEKPFQDLDRDVILAKVRRGDFPPPKELKPEIPPPLNAICLKAMALEPKNRYATALELASDIENWLADEPVLAYPETWLSRCGRWSRRHRSAVVSAGIFLLCSAIGLGISTALILAAQRKTEYQRRIAVKNYDISRAQSFQIIKLIETSEPEFAMEPTLHNRRAELLTTASNACRAFLKQEPDDVQLARRASQIFRFTANFHRLTYDTDRAEGFYEESIALREALASKFPGEKFEKLQLAASLRDYAHLRIRQGQLLDAQQMLNRSLELAGEPTQGENNPSLKRTIALGRLNLGLIDHRLGNHLKVGVTSNITEAEKLLSGLLEGNPDGRIPYDPFLLAAAINLSAIMKRECGDLDGALKDHNAAIGQLAELLKTTSRTVNNADIVHADAAFRIQQAMTWAKTGKPEDALNAETLVTEAIKALKTLEETYPLVPVYQESVASALNILGEIRLGRANDLEMDPSHELLRKARNNYEEGKDLNAGLVAKYPKLSELRWELGKSYAGLGHIAVRLKDGDPTLLFQKAESERSAALENSPDDTRFQRKLDVSQ